MVLIRPIKGGFAPPINPPEALRDLLQQWKIYRQKKAKEAHLHRILATTSNAIESTLSLRRKNKKRLLHSKTRHFLKAFIIKDFSGTKHFVLGNFADLAL